MELLYFRSVWPMGTALEQDGNGSVFIVHAGHLATQQPRAPFPDLRYLISSVECLPWLGDASVMHRLSALSWEEPRQDCRSPKSGKVTRLLSLPLPGRSRRLRRVR